MKTTLLVLAACGALLFVGGQTLSKNEKYQIFGELVHSIETEDLVVALTFDDGPTPERTTQVLDILDKEGVKATFYLNGNALEEHPDAGRLLVNSGHEIGNHSYSHPRMLFMSYAEVAREIESTEKIIRDYGYQGELRFRPPFGKKLLVLPWYLKKRGIQTVTWDVEPETWSEPRNSAEDRVERGINLTRPGSIILMHVMYGDNNSMQALSPMIRGLKEKGFRFLTVSQLLAHETLK